MACSAPSSPPPALREPRAKYLRRPTFEPDRVDAHNGFLDFFNAWCIERGISARDLQQLCRLRTVAGAQKKRTGESPLNFPDLHHWPARVRNDLVSSYLAWCASPSSSNSHG